MDTSQKPTAEDVEVCAVDSPKVPASSVVHKRGFSFWMVFVANLTVDLLSALDGTAVATALPTIAHHLNGKDFIWAGGAYTVASTAVLPLIGSLVSVFGRKPVLLCLIFIFAVGSAISGAAQSMNMLIAGRALQGLGGGGCISVTEIIYADLVPLPERGKFQGITASVWALACAIGPPIGGALADSGAWRWLFFLNLPLCGISMTLVLVFLKVRAPRSSIRESTKQMDWIGNVLIIGSTVSTLLALTWGGLQFHWSSVHVLTPLISGGVGVFVFGVYERIFAKHPTMPKFCFTSRTTLSGYLGTFFHGIVSLASIYYLPVYFQAAKGASATGSGVDLFGLVFIIPAFAVLSGLSVQVLGRYRPQNYVGWGLILVGFVVLSTVREDAGRARYIASQVPLGVGLGIVWISTQFPILAPLPFSNNAHALAFFTFVRCFAQSWGIVIGGAILQNTLLHKLPPAFSATLPQGVQVAYAVIPIISDIPEPLRTQIRTAFTEGTQLIWRVMIGISGAGLLTCFLMEEIPLQANLDEDWGLEGGEDERKEAVAPAV